MERAASVEETPVTVDGYGTLTEEQHSASLVRGRSLSEPVYHKPLYQIPVASLHLRSYNPAALDFFAHFASHAAASLGIPISKPVHLPTQRSMWTVPRSPFAHKKSQENFERKTYKRAIKAWDASPEVVDLWCQYMSRHSLHGVGMKVTKWEHHDLGAADAMYEEAANVRKDAFEEMRKQKDGIKQTAEKIIKEETKPTETTT
ncbi:ribosomal protein S10 domain-containing protein [Coprinopsis sp. MPI-PUGE-AT-0042]|nr:ribosomal protein S10 domain-containing protein [Coprinopsis sp. MPI-PUGE-AT-0042]